MEDKNKARDKWEKENPILAQKEAGLYTSTAMKMNTPMTPVIIKWLNFPWLKSLSLFLLLCTPKNAAATLLIVSVNDEFL